MNEVLKKRWPEYWMEAFALGLFMFAACAFSVLLESSSSLVRQSISNPFVRRALMGFAMGIVAMINIYSPWGRRSGAHMNPAVTVAFLRLKKISPADAFYYALFQCIGAAAGVALAIPIFGSALMELSVNYAATVPGPIGEGAAFLAETMMAFFLMAGVLYVSTHSRFSSWTGVFAGMLVASYIAFEAPISGMSINPARTLGSAVWAKTWQGIWIYFTAPFIGMLLAAESHLRRKGLRRVLCVSLNHSDAC